MCTLNRKHSIYDDISQWVLSLEFDIVHKNGGFLLLIIFYLMAESVKNDSRLTVVNCCNIKISFILIFQEALCLQI